MSRYKTTGRLLSLSKTAHQEFGQDLASMSDWGVEHLMADRRDDQPTIRVNGDPRPEIALPFRAPAENFELQRRFDFRKMAQWFR